MDKKYLYQIAFWLFVAMVLYATLASRPPIESPINIKNVDKGAHFFMFFAFNVLFHLNWRKASPILAIAVSSLFGILIEILQYAFTTDRSFELLDWAFDIAGAVAGTLFFFQVIKKHLSYL